MLAIGVAPEPCTPAHPGEAPQPRPAPQPQPGRRAHYAGVCAGLALAWAQIALTVSVVDAPRCSRLPQRTDECGCSHDTLRGAERLWTTAVAAPLVLLPLWIATRHVRAAVGAPRHPRLVQLCSVWLPTALVFVMQNWLFLGSLPGLLIAGVAMFAVAALWRPGAGRRALLAMAPHALVPALSGIFVSVFIEAIPDLAAAHPDHLGAILTLQSLALYAFSMAYLVVVAWPTAREYPVGLKAQLVRGELARTSVGHISMFLAVVQWRGDAVGDLAAAGGAHPVLAGLLGYVLIHVLTRLHVISVALGSAAGLRGAEIRARRPLVVSLYGSCMDSRWWAYVPVLAVRVLPRGAEHHWLYLCDGRFASVGADLGWIAVVFAADVAAELLYVGALWALRRRGPAVAHPFESDWAAAPVGITAAHACFTAAVNVVGHAMLSTSFPV